MKRPRHGRRAPEDGEKRRPTLADRFIARRWSDWERAVHPKTIAQLQKSARDARRFVLDEAATLRLAEIIDSIPELLIREHQFARAPYDLTWVEFPSHVLWSYMHEQHPAAYEGLGRFGDPEASDHTLGYLIDHERVNVICGGTVADPDTLPQIMPLQYRLHTPMEDAEQTEFRRLSGMTSEWHLNAFLWGSTYTRLSPEERAVATDRNSVGLLPLNPLHPLYPRYSGDGEWCDAVRGSIGELRNIIAVLLVLNRPSLTKYIRSNEMTRGFHKGKLMPYLSHTVVTIDLDARPTLKLIGTPAGDAEPKRRGEVRGHYKHDETARDFSRIAGCIHEYQPTHGPDDDWAPWPDAPPGVPGDPGCVRNWVCAACGGKRWWRRETGRGDAAKGFVVHDGYDVTA
jgi:hypothetical protein